MLIVLQSYGIRSWRFSPEGRTVIHCHGMHGLLRLSMAFDGLLLLTAAPPWPCIKGYSMVVVLILGALVQYTCTSADTIVTATCNDSLPTLPVLPSDSLWINFCSCQSNETTRVRIAFVIVVIVYCFFFLGLVWLCFVRSLRPSKESKISVISSPL